MGYKDISFKHENFISFINNHLENFNVFPLNGNNLNINAIKYFLNQHNIDINEIHSAAEISGHNMILGFKENHFFTATSNNEGVWQASNCNANVR